MAASCGPAAPGWPAGSLRTALSGLRTRQRAHDWGEKPEGGLRQAAGSGEWLRIAVMRGSAALPVVVPARDRDRNGPGPCPRQRDCGSRVGRAPGPGAADPPLTTRPPCSCPAPSAGGATAGSAGDLHTAADPGHSPRPPSTGTALFRFSPPAMGELTGPEPAQGGPEQARQPTAANGREQAGSPAGPSSGR